MTVQTRRSPLRRGLVCVIGLTAFALATPSLASAQHKAKLSRGLASNISEGSPETQKALVELPQSEVDRLVSQYGIRIEQRLAMGALISGRVAQFAAIAGDPAVRALADNDIVVGNLVVTTQTTGASLLWKGTNKNGNFSGLTGAGIGVAVIDSGIDASHPTCAVGSRSRWISPVTKAATPTATATARTSPASLAVRARDHSRRTARRTWGWRRARLLSA